VAKIVVLLAPFFGAQASRPKGEAVEEHFEDPEQPRRDQGPDPLAGEGSGEEEGEYESEREAEEGALDEER
jgi:hypothetical protein